MVARAVTRVEERGFPWWSVLIQGFALLVLGGLLLARPGMASTVVVQFAGVFWFILGILQIVSIFLDSSLWVWKLVAGVLGVLAGIVVIRHPLWSTIVAGSTLITLIAVLGITIGTVDLFQAIKGAGWATGILGVISVGLGLILLLNVWAFAFSLPWILGVFSFIGGVVAIVVAFRIK